MDLQDVAGGSVDLLICVHVVEYLKNPSEVFRKISKKMKKGGLLFLEAPWGGQPEHLPDAPVDRENKGGKGCPLLPYSKDTCGGKVVFVV